MTETKHSDAEIYDARAKLWERGILSWKLDAPQKSIYEFCTNNPKRTLVVQASRRLGKSFLLCILAFETCLRKKRSIVKYVAPEQKQVRTIIFPIIDQILLDCPENLRPKWIKEDAAYKFPNGSQIQIAGTDNKNYNKLRGGNSHLCIIDEAGTCCDLKTIVKSVLRPTTTLTRGKIILSSTPADTYDHEFNKYAEIAEERGTILTKTIYDALEDCKSEANPRFTPEIIEEVMQEYEGGASDPEFRREYLCERVKDPSRAVIAEWTDELERDLVVEWPRPVFYNAYTAMDLGFRDLTFVIFAYLDYMNAVIVIEDELVLNGPTMTTNVLADEIRKKENQHWYCKLTGETQAPTLRVSDNNMIVINDLHRLHGLLFMPTSKDDSDAALNQMKMKLLSHQIVINPRCKKLISHLKNATWNKTKTGYARSSDNGHYDGVDALKYLVRNIDYHKNPHPKGKPITFDTFKNPSYKQPSEYDHLLKMITPKSTKRKF